MYALWYGIKWLVEWLTRPPLLWNWLDWLAIILEGYSFYYIVTETKKFIKRKRNKYATRVYNRSNNRTSNRIYNNEFNNNIKGGF